jgi:hypothetical protein
MRTEVELQALIDLEAEGTHASWYIYTFFLIEVPSPSISGNCRVFYTSAVIVK